MMNGKVKAQFPDMEKMNIGDKGFFQNKYFPFLGKNLQKNYSIIAWYFTSCDASSKGLPLVSGIINMVRIAAINEIADKNPMANVKPYVANKYGNTKEVNVAPILPEATVKA